MQVIAEPDSLKATATINDISCNGAGDGSIIVTPTGGTTPYTYLWSNAATTSTISSLNAGSYTVTVTDANGCTTTSSGTVTEPNALVVSTTLNSNDTGGGTGAATASASGGTMPYSYLWSNGSNYGTNF